MKKVRLEITSGYDEQSVSLDDEIKIGRSNLADLILDDQGLSRLNTTIFRDENEVLVVDENSSNGTFLNGKRLGKTPSILRGGDHLTLGSNTSIRIEFGENGEKVSQEKDSPPSNNRSVLTENIVPGKKIVSKPQPSGAPKILLLIGGIGVIAIIALTGVAIFVVSYFGDDGNPAKVSRKAKSAAIPIRVIDPLGGQKQEGLEELVQYWEVQEKDVSASDLADTSGTETIGNEQEDYNVSVAFWEKQKSLALAARNAPTGNDPPGTKVPAELSHDGVVKQTKKIREMQGEGYVIPMDFADLARKRKAGELVELKMATDYWVLEVGGSSDPGPFTTFDFRADSGSPVIQPGSNDFNALLDLAGNFSGMKYDLLNPDARRQMKIRLLRMIHPRAKPILIQLAQAYQAKFNRPLRITSLQRSMQYQISLNRTNANSFQVRGAGSLPPHTSGCAFDLARKHMTAEEQNFLMEYIAQKEREGILDGLREGSLNACFHIFIYDDGTPPN